MWVALILLVIATIASVGWLMQPAGPEDTVLARMKKESK